MQPHALLRPAGLRKPSVNAPEESGRTRPYVNVEFTAELRKGDTYCMISAVRFCPTPLELVFTAAPPREGIWPGALFGGAPCCCQHVSTFATSACDIPERTHPGRKAKTSTH